MEKNKEALLALDATMDLDAQYLDGHVCRGGVLYSMGEFRKAEQAFQTAIDLEPEYPYALNGLGLCAEADGRRDEAMAFFERSVAADHDLTEPQQHLVRLRAVSNTSASTVQEWQDTAPKSPEDPTTLMNLGITYGNEGRFEEAFTHLSRAVRLDPQNGYAFLALARACGATNRFQEAERYALTAASLGEPEGNEIAQMARSMKQR